MQKLQIKKLRHLQINKCTVCNSLNTIELYPENIDIRKLSFTYEFSPHSQKTFRVVRCKNCSHVFCSPLPKNFYKNYQDVLDKEYLRHAETRRRTAIEVLKVIKNYKRKGLLLDVGCATGDFLIQAKEAGYEVDGLELSHWSSQIARKKGLPIYKQQLKSLAKRFSKRYDIITLWGVIEHFEHPKEEMIYLHQLLKKGGLLVIWTGDVDGLMSRLLGRRWWYWQGQHIQYFTQNSLDFLAKDCGLQPVVVKRYPIAATYEQLQNSLKRYKSRAIFLPLIKLFFKFKSTWFLSFPGEMFWIGTKK